MAETNKSNLRVLMVTPRYFPFMGGVETHVYEVSRRLVERGADITVLTTDPSGDLPKEEEAAGVRIKRVRTWPAQRDYYMAPGVVSEIVRGRWDVVHCQGVHTLVPPIAMLAAGRAEIPYVLTFHTGGHSSGLRNKVRGAQWKALRPLLRQARRLVGVSSYEKDYFQKELGLPHEQFAVIPNGGHLPQAAENNINAGEKLIVSAGRLERYKGHQHAIAALPLVQKKYPQARLLILGSGPYEGELHKLAAQLNLTSSVEIKSVPSGDRAAMSALLSRASVVTLLSEYESQGISVVEALALGRPALVAYNSGLMQFADAGLARSVPPGAGTDIVAQAIIQQIEDPLVPGSVQLPTWDECADNLLQVYTSAARR